MRRYNQILYADQTRSEEKFYGVDHAPCPGRNFGDTNADARSVPVANLHVLTCAGTQSLSPDLTPRRFFTSATAPGSAFWPLHTVYGIMFRCRAVLYSRDIGR